MKNILFSLAGLLGILALSAVGADKGPRNVELRGKLRTGIVAIGGETTGTVIETDKGRFELDLGKDKALRAKAERLNGKVVVVKGTLTIRKGVEVAERRIVAVRTLEPAGEQPRERPDVRGRVSRLTPARSNVGGPIGSILIDGNGDGGPACDKVWLRVTGKTRIERLVGGERQPARWEDLAEGCRVVASFGGAVMESDPIQVEADTLLILDEGS